MTDADIVVAALLIVAWVAVLVMLTDSAERKPIRRDRHHGVPLRSGRYRSDAEQKRLFLLRYSDRKAYDAEIGLWQFSDQPPNVYVPPERSDHGSNSGR